MNGINKIYIFSAGCIIYFFVWKIQNNLLLNSDVSWLSYAANRLIKGGKYGTDFFETNPPLILYLYTPLLLIQYLFHLNKVSSLLIYIFFISILSLTYIYVLLKRIFPQEYFCRIFIIFITSGLFLIIPLSEFGQREHLVILFCTPYYFLLAARLKNIIVSVQLEVFIGILAGIGFALKPYFYLPFLLAEIFYMHVTHNIASFRRTDFYLISLVGCIYLIIIILFNYNYISIILPLIQHTYYPKYQQTLKSLLLNEQSIYGYFLLFLYWLFYKKILYRPLINSSFTAFFGFWMVFIGQQMGWFYHALPFYSYAILLYSLLYFSLINKNNITKIDYVKLMLFNIILILFYFFYMPYIALSIYYFPCLYFILFGLIFFMMLYLSYKKHALLYAIINLVFILVLNIIFYYYVSITMLSQYLICLSMVMWFLSFLLFISKDKCHYSILALTGILIFAFPFYKIAYIENYSQYYKKLYHHLIIDIRPFSKKKVYFLSSASELTFPLIDYGQLNYVSRFWSLIWLPLMKDPTKIKEYDKFYEKNQAELDYYINCIVQDFIHKKPQIIFVDIRGKGYFFNIPMNYIYLFSKNNQFKNEWQYYHFLKIVDFPPLYKFAVYTL